MAKKKMLDESKSIESSPADPEEVLDVNLDAIEDQHQEIEDEKKIQKIGVIQRNWVESKQISPHASEKIFNSIHAGTIIYDQEEIERLKCLGAPIKVYIEYGSH